MICVGILAFGKHWAWRHYKGIKAHKMEESCKSFSLTAFSLWIFSKIETNKQIETGSLVESGKEDESSALSLMRTGSWSSFQIYQGWGEQWQTTGRRNMMKRKRALSCSRPSNGNESMCQYVQGQRGVGI